MYEIIIGRDQNDRERYGIKGTIFLGRQYVTMGQTTALSNEVYMDMLRSHVVLICGKRGCLSGETLIFTDKGYKKIKNFDEKDDKILSFDKKNKCFIWESAKLLHYTLDNENLLYIKFSRGKEIVLTTEHPLLVYKKSKLFWVEAHNLRVHDMLVLPIGLEQIKKNKKKLNEIKLTYKEIIKIKTKKIKEVYDLSVNKNHSFIGNGIISHNSGKSYTLGVIAEGMANLAPEIKQNLSIILLDTMGVYWTMKYGNKKELPELKEWNMEPKGLDVQIYTPHAFYKEYKDKGIPTDFPFSLQPIELTPDDWAVTFEISLTEPLGVVLEKIITDLAEQFEGKSYSIQDILLSLEKQEEPREIKEALKNRFLNVASWGIFDKNGTPMEDLAGAGKVSVLDLSCYATMPNGWKIKCLIVGLLAKKIFIQRMRVRKEEEFSQLQESLRYFSTEESVKQEFPLVWLTIDEAHEFLPKTGKTAATDSLITILREGRQPGISLILATQQPGKIHTDVMTQSDTVLSHRITAKIDTESLGALMQSYMREGLSAQLDKLPRTKGSALLFDDTNEKLYPIKIRPRFTWHGGESPTAYHEKAKKYLF